jgi:lipid A 1-phosphatase
MKFSRLLLEAATAVKNSKPVTALCLLLLCLCIFYPSDLQEKSDFLHGKEVGLLVHDTDRYGRFFNTFLQVALPIATRDIVGLKQLVVIAVAGTIATHGLKRALNDVEVVGTRLGQRPVNANSKHNMPSGHSSLAASGAYFVCRRYGYRLALVVVPILFMTMYARVMLDAHTISAVLAGALVGIFTAALFTTRYKWSSMPLNALMNHLLVAAPVPMGRRRNGYKRIFLYR